MSTLLLQLIEQYGTDKAVRNYHVPYSRLFDHIRQDVTKVLEIGVKRGASLRVWKDYFPRAQIFGIDNDPACATGDWINFIGNQADSTFLARTAESIGHNINFIVDDGAHLSDHQITSLTTLWPYLSSNDGVYAIEDLHAQVSRRAYAAKATKLASLHTLLQRRFAADIAKPEHAARHYSIVLHGDLVLFVKHAEGPPPILAISPSRRKKKSFRRK